MRCLGIDIDDDAFRAVLIHSGWTGVKILQTLEVARAGRPFEQVQKDLEGKLKAKPHRVCVSLDRSRALFRTIELPIKDPARVAKAAPFKAEEVLPVGLDKVRVCPLKARPVAERRYSVPVFAADLERIESRESMLVAGLSPYLQIDSLGALEAALETQPRRREGERTLLIDVAHRGIHLEMIDAEGLVTSRSLRLGLAKAVSLMATDLGPKAEDLWPRFLAEFLDPGTEPPAERLAALRPIFQSLETEARRTFESQGGPATSRDRVLLTGIGAHLAGLKDSLGAVLDAKVEVLDVASLKKVEHAHCFHRAFGLALAASDRRRLEIDFSTLHRPSILEDPIAGGILALGLFLAGGLLSLRMVKETYDYEDSAAKNQAMVQDVLHKVGLSPQKDLKEQISKVRRLLGAFRGASRSPARVMDALSESVPVGGVLRFESVEIRDDTVKVVATAENLLQAGGFEEALRDHPGFEEVRVLQQSSQNNRQDARLQSRFTIEAKLVSEVFR